MPEKTEETPVVAPFTPLDTPLKINGVVAGVLALEPNLPDFTKNYIVEAQCLELENTAINVYRALYAVRDQIGQIGWTAIALLADIVYRSRWMDDGKDGTALTLTQIARRERGEAGPHPDPANDPAPRAEYTKPREGPKTFDGLMGTTPGVAELFR